MEFKNQLLTDGHRFVATGMAAVYYWGVTG